MEKSIGIIQMGLEVNGDVAHYASTDPDDDRPAAERAADAKLGESTRAIAELVARVGLVTVLEALRDAADAGGDMHDDDREACRELRAFSANIGRAIEAVS